MRGTITIPPAVVETANEYGLRPASFAQALLNSWARNAGGQEGKPPLPANVIPFSPSPHREEAV